MTTQDLIRQAQSLAQAPADAYLTEQASLGAVLAERVRTTPDALFLAYFDDDAQLSRRFTWKAFDALVGKLAQAFSREHGIGRGDCVATLAYNHPLAAAALFACWRLGALAAPQNVHEGDSHIAFILKDCEAKVLLHLPELSERARRIAAEAGLQRVATLEEPVSGEALPDAGKDLRADAALLVYTSGTTGKPKGVVLTQFNLLINAHGTREWHALDAGMRMMCVLPIHHVNGIVVTLITPLVAGASVVLNRAFKASVFWQRLADEKAAIVSVVPTILQFLCEAETDISRLDLAHFRYVICGAGTLPISLAQRFEAKYGFPVVHGYGLSETTAFACTMPVDIPDAERRDWQSQHGFPSIGVPLAHCEMAIHDPEGAALGAGEHGEIVVRGPYVMAGYFHREDANAETFKHGWFRSGDEGFYLRDRAGRMFFFITGRLKELINRAGVKYSPFEIEEVLLEIGGVKVGLAIAFENKWYGEEVGAYVVKADGATVTEAEILAHCRERMPFDKCPKVVVFGTEVPVTVTGKYQRLKLQPLFSEYSQTQFRK